MADTIPGFVIFIGAVIIAALIVSLGFVFFNSQKENSEVVLEQSNRLATQLSENEWMQYDGETVRGSEVLSVIKHMRDSGTYVAVDVGSGATYYCYDSSLNPQAPDDFSNAYKDAKTRGNGNYINPNSTFEGKVDRDATTDGILGITFTKN